MGKKVLPLFKFFDSAFINGHIQIKELSLPLGFQKKKKKGLGWWAGPPPEIFKNNSDPTLPQFVLEPPFLSLHLNIEPKRSFPF